jgi:hypothetical protein
MIKTSRSIIYMLIFLWLLVPLLLVAGIVIWNLTGKTDTSFIHDSHSEATDHWPLYLINTKKEQYRYWTGLPEVIVNILFVAALQLLYTIALHVAEQFANLHRDEQAWRYASRLNPDTGGALIGRDATKAAVTAWPTVFLFIMKPVCHWIFGLSFPVDQYQSILYHPLPVFALAGAFVLLASFSTYLALRRPVGPQPSANGKIQRLVDMIDDWGQGAGGRIFWGDKTGQNDGISARRVGTSGDARDLTEVKINEQTYLGMKEDEVLTKGVKRT